MLLDENCTWQDYSGPGHTREIMASVTLIFFILLLESGSNTTEPNSHFHKKTVKSDLILLSASGDQREVNIILWRICKWILSQTINLFINSLWLTQKTKDCLAGGSYQLQCLWIFRPQQSIKM